MFQISIKVDFSFSFSNATQSFWIFPQHSTWSSWKFSNKVTEKLQPQEGFPLSDSDFPVFSSGALKKNLTAEQIKEDLVILGTHPNPSSQSRSWAGSVWEQGLSVAAGYCSLMTACHVEKYFCSLLYTWNQTCFICWSLRTKRGQGGSLFTAGNFP